jgi:hypothetical protein
VVKSEGSPRGFALLNEGVAGVLEWSLPADGSIRLLEHAYSGCIRILRLHDGAQVELDLYSAAADTRTLVLDRLFS